MEKPGEPEQVKDWREQVMLAMGKTRRPGGERVRGIWSSRIKAGLTCIYLAVCVESTVSVWETGDGTWGLGMGYGYGFWCVVWSNEGY